MVNNLKELEMLMIDNDMYAATVGHSVSLRARKEIVGRAEQLAVRGTNAATRVCAEDDV